MEIGELIKELTIELTALFRDKLRTSGISVAQCLILFSVPTTGVDMSSLAERVNLDKSTITRLIDKLVERGFVIRTSGEKDRRVRHIALTQPGVDLVQDIDASLDDIGFKLSSLMSLEEVENVKGSLNKLIWSLSLRKWRNNS